MNRSALLEADSAVFSGEKGISRQLSARLLPWSYILPAKFRFADKPDTMASTA